MSTHVTSALFVYTEETKKYQDLLQESPFDVDLRFINFDELEEKPSSYLTGVAHVVVAGPMGTIKAVLQYSIEYEFSVGIIPSPNQVDLIRCYRLPNETDKVVDLALRKDAVLVDLVLCNDIIVLFKATMGRIPLIESPGNISRLRLLAKSCKRFFGLRLLKFSFTTVGGQKVETAACGSMIVHHVEGTLASRLIYHDSSFWDGMVSLVVVSPYSIMEYLKFLAKVFRISFDQEEMPSTIGYIKSSSIDIVSEVELDVFVDGERATHTPLNCRVIPAAVRVNIGESLRTSASKGSSDREDINIKNLPAGREIVKATKKSIPFFTYATHDRFKELFKELRGDARLNNSFLVLMVLSTMLATVGLYLDSTSVVIGAMLLAPLMSPIVSFSMGILRNDGDLIKRSAYKIAVGIVIALMAASLITLMFPHNPITQEMRGRLNPTLLDLAVAIIAGVAAAYTRSFKEVLQNMAGVGIAVALIPPLAVAGIGLGRGDLQFFYQAFLLFSTNLIGITMAASVTFLALGYSAVIRIKRSFPVIVLVLVAISVPLYMSYNSIVEEIILEKSWKHERFLIDGKYIIVDRASISHQKGRKMLYISIMTREPLSRSDLTIFKDKIQTHFSKKLIVRVKVTYIP